MYQVLQKGEWQIADTCPKLIEAIPSRMHDEKKPGDVLKVPGDPLDDVADDARYGAEQKDLTWPRTDIYRGPRSHSAAISLQP